MLTIKALDTQRMLIQKESLEARQKLPKFSLDAREVTETLLRVEDRTSRLIIEMERYLHKYGRANLEREEVKQVIAKLALPEPVQNCLLSIRDEVQGCAAEMSSQLTNIEVQRDAAIDRSHKLEGQVARLTTAVLDETSQVEKLQKKLRKLQKKLRRARRA